MLIMLNVPHKCCSNDTHTDTGSETGTGSAMSERDSEWVSVSETQLNRNASQTELNCRNKAVSARTVGQKEREREEREREKRV